MFNFLRFAEEVVDSSAVLETEATEQAVELSQFDKLFQFGFIKNLENERLALFLIKCFEVVAIIFALIILCKIVDWITKGLRKRWIKRGVDKTATKAIYNIVNKGLKIILILIAVGCLGIDTTSIVGLFTAAGLGVGLAVQGALSNFAGGFLILVLRPFKVDDYIEGSGVAGTVEDIHLFYTELCTPDNKLVHVPNGALIGSNIINYSVKETRRIDIPVSVDYDTNVFDAEKALNEVCLAHALILKDPAPAIRVASHADSAIVINVRVWCKNGDYWTVFNDLQEQIIVCLEANNIKVPYPQLEVSYRDGNKR